MIWLREQDDAPYLGEYVLEKSSDITSYVFGSFESGLRKIAVTADETKDDFLKYVGLATKKVKRK